MYGIQFVHLRYTNYTKQTNYLLYKTLILLSEANMLRGIIASASLNSRYFSKIGYMQASLACMHVVVIIITNEIFEASLCLGAHAQARYTV